MLRCDPHLQPVAGAEMQRRPGVLRQFRLQCGVKGVLRRAAGLQDHDGGKNVVDDLADGAGEGIDAALRRGEDIVAADAEHRDPLRHFLAAVQRQAPVGNTERRAAGCEAAGVIFAAREEGGGLGFGGTVIAVAAGVIVALVLLALF